MVLVLATESERLSTNSARRPHALACWNRYDCAGLGQKETTNYMHWRVVENTLSLFASGLDEMDRWQISLWDAMILAAARYAGAKIVWSEDLSEDQDYDGIEIVNPLN